MIRSVKLNGNQFLLSREGDGEGDFGYVTSHDLILHKKYPNEIRVGCRVQCGSRYARTMQMQDYWLTSTVVKILEKAKDNSWVKFQTRNSIYMVKS